MTTTKKSSAKNRRNSHVRENRGLDFYQDIGHKGGLATAAHHDRKFYQEIGSQGGRAVADEYGPEFYQDIGHKGGLATASRHDRKFYQEIGSRGGRAVAREYGPEFYQDIGHKGGVATASRHDRKFYQEIGSRGGRAVAEEYGPEFYHRIGHQGGLTTASRHGREFYQDIGSRGGHSSHSKGHHDEDEHNYDEEQGRRRGTMSRQEAGHRGGQATASRHGRGFYQEIGEQEGHARGRSEAAFDEDERDYGKEQGRYHGSMSRQEAGHRGSQATASRHGRGFYQEIGEQGNPRSEAAFDEADYGEEQSRYHGRMNRQEAGHRGGQATASRHDPDFDQEEEIDLSIVE